MDSIIPISDLQTKAKKYVDQVKATSKPIVITQRGRAAAVLVGYEEFEGLKATQDEMSYSDWNERLERAERDFANGKGIPLEVYLKNQNQSS